jgi:Flp pilus assembly pilin Flp
MRKGSASIEYTLLLGFILLVVVSVVAGSGSSIGGIWHSVTSRIEGKAPAAADGHGHGHGHDKER